MGSFIYPFVGTRVGLIKLNLVYYGAPFCFVPADYPVNLLSANYTYYGSPMVTYYRGGLT